MGRTVIVGDVHGCRSELEELLVTAKWAEGVDRLFLVGDLVARGPDSLGVLALVERLGGCAVRGNHEDKLLRVRNRAGREGEHAQLASLLSPEDWHFLEQMPLWVDLSEHGLRVVHAGVVPGQAIERTPPEALLTIRAIDASGRWSDDKEQRPHWGE
ncbi:MAG TPA: metallophosphoesterase, partial [Polyangiaceae bacterium]|nr:metallophosphoesterase [Polyangiaceae bacterium]